MPSSPNRHLRQDRDKCACGNRHIIGKCERAHRETGHRDREEAGSKSASRTYLERKENHNEPELKSSNHWVPRSKLSTLYIFSIPSFVQPSSLITTSTSWRRDSVYSGLERRRLWFSDRTSENSQGQQLKSGRKLKYVHPEQEEGARRNAIG